MNFPEFFEAVYGVDNSGKSITPFPWQERLAKEVLAQGWRSVLDLPTASGKTSAIDVAVFQLIQQLEDIRAGKLSQRTAPLRVFFIVDRRIVVDGAFRHAQHLAAMLREATEGPLKEAGDLLRDHFHVDQPLQVSLMRGGMYRDNGWTASPVQPTICVSTVDQVGSRLLFRGYGVSPSMRPIHAGLVANDSLLLIDEAHLSEPFLQTLNSVRLFAGERFAERPVGRPFRVVRMSATNADGTLSSEEPFQIEDEDREHPVLGLRFKSNKVAGLEKISVDKDDTHAGDEQFASTIVTRAIAISELASASDSSKRKVKKKQGAEESVAPARVIGIVVNRVHTARLIFDKLRRRNDFRDPLDMKSGEPLGEDRPELAETILLTGRMRPWDRDELLFRKSVGGKNGWLEWIQSGRADQPRSPIFVVATQTVEVGADLDFDALITEAAPLDCLRQRFGRLDRRGYRKRSQALVVARSVDVAKTAKDRVYGDRLTKTWQWLEKNAAGKGKNRTIDFGIAAMDETLQRADLSELCAVRDNAPVLLPPYLDLWVRTNPAPAADPDVVPFLHGPGKTPADVQVVWRADLLADGEESLSRERQDEYIDTIAKLRPSSMEACSMPIYEVQRWLSAMQNGEQPKDERKDDIGDIADVEGDDALESASRKRLARGKLVVRWKGEEKSRIGTANDLRPGDTIVVPASYGGHDAFGWQPQSKEVNDIAEGCSRWGRARPVVRLHAGLLTDQQWGQMSFEQIADDNELIRKRLEKLLELDTLPDAVRRSCGELISDPSWNIPYKRGDKIIAWLVVRKQRLKLDQVLAETRGEFDDGSDTDALPDENEQSSFTGSGVPVTLEEHSNGVVAHVQRFASLAGLDQDFADDLRIVAQWHDVGKIDERFQTLLHDGDYIEAVVALSSGSPLAKSGQPVQDRAARARARRAAGVPKGFRHETLSVVLLRHSQLKQVLEHATDKDLVEYLSGSHHGNGRASHDVVLREDGHTVDRPPSIDATWNSQHLEIDSATQIEQAIYRLDSSWEALFVRMNRRYGYWGLAWLEAIFRLADHRQSAFESMTSEQTREAGQL
ncbi:MAG: type I-U CRISPR-associated helicase/endonuclease Cas3 [Candidatus Paceibacterota bacterium]